MRTASRLSPCGYADVLGLTRIRSPSSLRSMDLGTQFHALAHHTFGAGPPVAGKLSRTVVPWLNTMLDSPQFPAWAQWELALGLGHNCEYVPVNEPEPHNYIAVDPTRRLMTAGRGDILWGDTTGTGRLANVLDIKTGRFAVKHPSFNPQLWALGFAYAGKLAATAIRTGVYYARTGVYEWHGPVDVGSSEAADRWSEIQAYANAGPEPLLGEHCGDCWERNACEAYKGEQSVEFKEAG